MKDHLRIERTPRLYDWRAMVKEASMSSLNVVIVGIIGLAPAVALAIAQAESPQSASQGQRVEIRVGIEEGDFRGSDNRALQAAVDYAAGLGGGTVRIGPGRYEMRNSLTLRSNV